MANLKHSRQRASIKEYLDHTTDHPTADIVYQHVRKKYPNISLATVYRNLNLLADQGEIVKIPTPDGADRFDSRLNPHSHVICTCCGKVFDLEFSDKQRNTINHLADGQFDGSIEEHSLLFYGTCSECLKEQND